jgi:hypothetical protein
LSVEDSMSEHGPLREQLRQMFERERLDELQYQRLRALTDRPRRRLAPMGWWAVAAAAVVALIAILLLPRPGDPAWQLDQIARHVSHYHLQTPPLEVESDSLQAVRAALDRLDFQPVLPVAAESAWRLQGARHCTLLGGVASQLLFLAEDGQRITLYEAAYDPQRFGTLPVLAKREPPLRVLHRGLEIRVWVEAGIVMAEVRAPRGSRGGAFRRNSV